MADDMGTQLNQFADNLKLLKKELVGKIIAKAMREAMDPVQRVAGAQYLQRTGAHDFNQTEAKLLNRWGGSKSNRHPVGESRQRVAASILKIKTKSIRGIRKNASGEPHAILYKLFGKTQNSWLLEFGRYRDAARKYHGWGTLQKVVNTMETFTQGKLVSSVKEQMDKAANKFWRDFAKFPKAAKGGAK